MFYDNNGFLQYNMYRQLSLSSLVWFSILGGLASVKLQPPLQKVEEFENYNTDYCKTEEISLALILFLYDYVQHYIFSNFTMISEIIIHQNFQIINIKMGSTNLFPVVKLTCKPNTQ